MTVYLGFSCSQHDPSIAVVSEAGEVLFAEANERALKYKRGWHATPDPFGVIEPILAAYVGEQSVSASLTWSRPALRSTGTLAALSRVGLRAVELLRPHHLEAELARGWAFRHGLYRAPPSANEMLLNLELRLKEVRGFSTSIRKRAWNHHLCHAVTACYSSPFAEALCVVIDGMGEGTSTSVYSFQDGQLKRLDPPRLPSLASLGIYYSQICFAAGFDPLAGEEWKLMGLAAYGTLDRELHELLRSALRVKNLRFVQTPAYASVLDRLAAYRGRAAQANADLAFTAQQVFEELLYEFLEQAHRRWGAENLILTGGCALNSSANGKILSSGPFKRLHVPMAPGDDGNSVGAALLDWQAAHPMERVPRFTSPYLGSSIADEAVARLSAFGISPDFVARDMDDLASHVADELAAGAVAGWMQGRAEFGPRALGSRSILADPRPHGIRDRLNASIKLREEFRPFAPSILHEHGPDYFEDYTYSPYMERTLRWRPGKAPSGVCHVDRTGRLQSVTRDVNPAFHALLAAFHRKTGLPILLNTSFNVMGRPMVHDIEDAIGVFMTSDLDLLVLKNMVFRKTRRPNV